MENKMQNNETAKLKDETINKGETVNKNQKPEALSDQELEQASGGLSTDIHPQKIYRREFRCECGWKKPIDYDKYTTIQQVQGIAQERHNYDTCEAGCKNTVTPCEPIFYTP